MAVVPYTDSDLTNIRALMVQGAGRVRFQGGPNAGQEVTYFTYTELRQVESMIIRAMQTTPKSKQMIGIGGSGL